MGTHPIFESDFDCLTEIGKMSQKSKPGWMSTLFQSDSFSAETINQSSSKIYRSMVLPQATTIASMEWQQLLKSNRLLTDRYRMEKEKSAKLQQRILEYQSRMSDHLVETASYRQEIERMKRQNDQLERQNQGMKRVLENAV